MLLTVGNKDIPPPAWHHCYKPGHHRHKRSGYYGSKQTLKECIRRVNHVIEGIFHSGGPGEYGFSLCGIIALELSLMASMTATSHQELILDQFTRQAIPFSNAKTIADESALRLLVEFSRAGPQDSVLDVACGGGLVVCAFAKVVQHATGIDVTPAMLDRSRALARDEGLSNVSWKQGDVESLPYPDGAFTIVVSRFTFHHFQNPLAVLKEMVRVCAPNGHVVVADVAVSTDAAKAAEFNRMEILRDPSHVRAMQASELRELFRSAGLPEPRATAYELRDELENLLRRSFPNPGDEQKIREIFAASALDDRLGIPVRRQESRIHYAYPVAVLAALKPPSELSGAAAK